MCIFHNNYGNISRIHVLLNYKYNENYEREASKNMLIGVVTSINKS